MDPFDIINSSYLVDISREDAELALSKIPNLIICRKSSTEQNCLAVSYHSAKNKRIEHSRAAFNDRGQIVVNEKTYNNLDIFIENLALRNNKVLWEKRIIKGFVATQKSKYILPLNLQQIAAITNFYPEHYFIRPSSVPGCVCLDWYEASDNILHSIRYAYNEAGHVQIGGESVSIEGWVSSLAAEAHKKVLSKEQLPSLLNWNLSSNQAQELAQQNPNHLLVYINSGERRVETVCFSDDVFRLDVLQPSLSELTSLDANDLFQSDILKPLLSEANSLDATIAYYAQTLGLPVLYPFNRARNHENSDYFSADIANCQEAEHILLSHNNHKDFLIFYEDFEQDCLNVCMAKTNGCGKEEIIHLPLVQDKKGDVFYDHRFLALSTVLHCIAGQYEKSFIRCKTSYQPCMYSQSSDYSFQPLAEVVDSSEFEHEMNRHKIELDSII